MPPRPPSRGSAPRRLLGPFGSAPRRLLGPLGSAPRPVSVVVPCPRVPRRGSVPPERRVVVPCLLFLFCTSKRAAGPEFAACRGDRAISSCTTGFRSCITGCEARPRSVGTTGKRWNHGEALEPRGRAATTQARHNSSPTDASPPRREADKKGTGLPSESGSLLRGLWRARRLRFPGFRGRGR